MPEDERVNETLRTCKVCGRVLSSANKHPDLCFHHQTPDTKFGKDLLRDREAHEDFVRGAAPVCTSRVVKGFSRVAIEYDGDGRNA